MDMPFPIRKECPPGACVCNREALLENPHADRRILQLTQQEEKKLVERLENIATLAELNRMQERMQALLGITITITPSDNVVRTTRGFRIELADQPGLCRKTRQAIPAAIRRSMEAHPDIAFEILDQRDLLGGSRNLFGESANPEE
jgi:Trp operon repressor